LPGLGIGGLAFALAAQDTIANLFGSIVVAIDQPFKLGETREDRRPHRHGRGHRAALDQDPADRPLLVILPNKLVSSEPITNLSRFTQRRVEQVIGLTYGTTPAPDRARSSRTWSDHPR